MTDIQLYLAIGVPILFNAAMFTLFASMLNKRIDDKIDGLSASVNARFDSVNARFESVNARFDGVNARFDSVNQRFDDMRDLWRAELHRVEEILDARLKHIEEERH
jgi:hypothetical protein